MDARLLAAPGGGCLGYEPSSRPPIGAQCQPPAPRADRLAGARLAKRVWWDQRSRHRGNGGRLRRTPPLALSPCRSAVACERNHGARLRSQLGVQCPSLTLLPNTLRR